MEKFDSGRPIASYTDLNVAKLSPTRTLRRNHVLKDSSAKILMTSNVPFRPEFAKTLKYETTGLFGDSTQLQTL